MSDSISLSKTDAIAVVAAMAPAPSTSVRQSKLPIELPSHIPALDGIRGLAVLLVLFCHATQRPFGTVGAAEFMTGPLDKIVLAIARISWTGVDMFFVLSGFLITGILFDAKGKQKY